MNSENQGNGPDSSSNILLKRKRGRPRKDQNQNISRIANTISMRDRIQSRSVYVPIAPGFARANGNHSHQENAADHDDDSVVGQTVTGVVEATFDAGYLLSVRVGNSETSLRGIVFKPGHFVPVSTENDVAPHIQMIRRNVVPFPSGFHTPVHGSYRRGRGRGKARSESRLSYSANGSSAGNQLQLVPVQPAASLVGDRGAVVPVVLQPADLSNGVAPAMEAPPLVSQPAHLAASRARVPNATQIDQMEKDLEIDNDSPSMMEAHHMEGSMLKLPHGVKQELVSEIQNERAQTSMEDLSPPLLVEPLQAFHSDFINQSRSVPQNLREARAGKMTELLLAVQENVIDKQATDVQHHDFRQQQN